MPPNRIPQIPNLTITPETPIDGLESSLGLLSPSSDRPEISSGEQCTLEVVEDCHEVERATWVALVHLAILLNPEVAQMFDPALQIGTTPVRAILIAQEAADILDWFITSMWGEGTIIIPIVTPAYTISDHYGIPIPRRTYSAVQPCSQLRVMVQPLEVTTCSPYESRVLNLKAKYKSATPFEALKIGLGLADGSGVLKTPVTEVGERATTGSTHKSSKRVMIRPKQSRSKAETFTKLFHL